MKPCSCAKSFARQKEISSFLKVHRSLVYHWPKKIWPPSSQDCNPLDYFMWSVVERRVYEQPHSTLASLRTKILEVMADMERDVIISASKKFRVWIEAVVKANGDFIA